MKNYKNITILLTPLLGLYLNLLSYCPNGDEYDTSALETHLIELISSELTQTYPQSEYRFDITIKRVPKKIRELEISMIDGIRFIQNKPPKGYTRLHIETTSKDITNLNSQHIQAYIQLWQKLPLLRRSKKEGERIDEADIHLQWLDITRISGPFTADLEKISPNMVLARLLQKGSPIRMYDFKKEAIVFAGDPITMIMDYAGYRIEILCTARQDGAIGEEIRCYAEENRKTYRVEILNKGVSKWKHTF